MTDISTFGFKDDVEFVRYLIKDVGVAGVPGSSFYKDPSKGRTQLRFCFCKKDETLLAADERLAKLVPATPARGRTDRTCSSGLQRPEGPLHHNPLNLSAAPRYGPFSLNVPVSFVSV